MVIVGADFWPVDDLFAALLDQASVSQQPNIHDLMRGLTYV